MLSIIAINKTVQLSFVTNYENVDKLTSKITLLNFKLNANLDDTVAIVDNYSKLREGSLSKATIVNENLLIKREEVNFL